MGESVLAQLWQYRGLVAAFATRDRLTRFRSSAVGWIWALAQPLATLVILSIVFGVIIKVTPPPLGDGGPGSYPAFIFTGVVAWNVFTGTLNVSMSSLQSVGSLRSKVYFPAWAPILGSSIIQFLQVLLEFGVLLMGLLWLGNIAWTWLLAIPILLGLLLFAQGVGLLAAILNARYGDTQHVVAVTLGIAYFLTPILYPLSAIEGQGRLVGIVIRANPLSWYVEAMHDALYSLTPPGAQVVALLLAGGGAAFTLGLRIFDKMSEDVGELM
jgi:ABC-type polysaccharide/polyol phosphate export permease